MEGRSRGFRVLAAENEGRSQLTRGDCGGACKDLVAVLHPGGSVVAKVGPGVFNLAKTKRVGALNLERS